MLIRDAELDFGSRRADVRVEGAHIISIGDGLSRRSGESVVEAQGRALLPSLRDHHIHLQATAAARASVDISPARCPNSAAVADALRQADADMAPGEWLRAVGFHGRAQSEADPSLSRTWLDRVVPERPVRVQHRSGRLWVLNSAALRGLGVDPDNPEPPLERDADGVATGRLFDADDWLRARLVTERPSLAALSRALWGYGVTAVTDCSHGNDADDFTHFARMQHEGVLLQQAQVMGVAALHADAVEESESIWVGARKFHLHDHDLPDFEDFKQEIRDAHALGRNVAMHCVSRVDLTFALSALREVGVRPGDRIEHASVAPGEAVSALAALGLIVVTQPAMIAERGDDYLQEVAADDQPHLYRLASLQRAGIPLALSSDAPYTDIDPWRAMQAAVDRRTASGVPIAAEEALSPEAAFAAMTGNLSTPGRPCALAEGGRADMILLDTDWAGARVALGRIRPVSVWRNGATTIT